MKKTVSIIVPCFNEEENIEPLAGKITEVLDENKIISEVILVDDGSTDGTKRIIKKVMRKYTNIKGISHEKNRGIVAGWKTGLRLSKGDYIVVIDADLQYSPKDIVKLYKMITAPALINKKCVVQGYRENIEKKLFFRYGLSKSLSYILNSLFSMSLKDNKSGFLICKKEAFQDILSYKYKYNYFQHFIMVSAHKKGYKIVQIPVDFAERKKGKPFISSIPLGFIIKTIVDLPKAYIEFKDN